MDARDARFPLAHTLKRTLRLNEDINAFVKLDLYFIPVFDTRYTTFHLTDLSFSVYVGRLVF